MARRRCRIFVDRVASTPASVPPLPTLSFKRLVLNRAKTQVMCNAYSSIHRDDATSKWMVQPMFISPRTKRPTPFPCSTAVDANGVLLVDENGMAMIDQDDTHF